MLFGLHHVLRLFLGVLGKIDYRNFTFYQLQCSWSPNIRTFAGIWGAKFSLLAMATEIFANWASFRASFQLYAKSHLEIESQGHLISFFKSFVVLISGDCQLYSLIDPLFSFTSWSRTLGKSVIKVFLNNFMAVPECFIFYSINLNLLEHLVSVKRRS